MCLKKVDSKWRSVSFINNDLDELAVYNVYKKEIANSPYFLKIGLRNRLFEGQVDTGSSVSLMSERFYKENCASVPLEKGDNGVE